MMTLMVRDVIEVLECSSLDRLIECLRAARDQLPNSARAEVRLRNDAPCGRSISISFLRPVAPEESDCTMPHEDSYLGSLLKRLAAIEEEMAGKPPTLGLTG